MEGASGTFGRLARLEQCRVAVIGDLMLDVFLHGDVERISPEAPVPVIRRVSEKRSPGGAANVAANVSALGASVRLVGLVGDDGGLATLHELLAANGDVDLSGVVRDPGRGTIRKLRVLGQSQQIARIDYEDTHPPSEAVERELTARAVAAAEASDVVVLSDYGKGVLSDSLLARVIHHAKHIGRLVIVDPKRRDLSAYRGADIVTPNRVELALATGMACETDSQAEAAARAAQAVCGAAVMLTRSEKGMTFFPIDGEPIHLPTVAREVFDVTGAGDTVVAVLATTLAADFPISDAMKAANHAAGIVVGKVGTATLSRKELAASLNEDQAERLQDGRLARLAEAISLCRTWRDQGLTVGVANGCFDLLHPGHVALIRAASGSCDRLIMALNSDASVRRLKGPSRPLQDERSRAEVIGALKGVALVVLFEEDTPLALIEALQPDVLVKGADYAEAEVVGADVVRARGGKVMRVDLAPGHSTSRLVARGVEHVA